MPAKARHTIYIEVVILKPEHVAPLTKDEALLIPCHTLTCRETEKKMLVIEYTPGSALATREQVIKVNLAAYARQHKHKIISHIVFDDQQPPV